MSDSDDDWFDKEIDDFVVNVQDKVVADEGINLVNNFMGGPSKFFDSGIGDSISSYIFSKKYNKFVFQTTAVITTKHTIPTHLNRMLPLSASLGIPKRNTFKQFRIRS